MKNWKTNESSISSIPTSVRRPFDNSASPQTTAIDSVPRIHLAGVIPGRSVNQTSARSDDVGSLSMDCYPATYLPVTYLFASGKYKNVHQFFSPSAISGNRVKTASREKTTLPSISTCVVKRLLVLLTLLNVVVSLAPSG